MSPPPPLVVRGSSVMRPLRAQSVSCGTRRWRRGPGPETRRAPPRCQVLPEALPAPGGEGGGSHGEKQHEARRAERKRKRSLHFLIVVTTVVTRDTSPAVSSARPPAPDAF